MDKYCLPGGTYFIGKSPAPFLNGAGDSFVKGEGVLFGWKTERGSV